jgi:Tfp pilus assembly protein PilN
MLNKTSFNFFSGQEFELKSQKNKRILLIAVLVLLVAAVIFSIWWGGRILQEERDRIARIEERMGDPDMLARVAEVDRKEAQLKSLTEYADLAKTLLAEVRNTHHVSTNNLQALLKEMPQSIQVSSIDLVERVWRLDCKTANVDDIAALMSGLEKSDEFGRVFVGNMATDPFGVTAFSIEMQLEGDDEHADE